MTLVNRVVDVMHGIYSYLGVEFIVNETYDTIKRAAESDQTVKVNI